MTVEKHEQREWNSSIYVKDYETLYFVKIKIAGHCFFSKCYRRKKERDRDFKILKLITKYKRGK